MLTINMQVTRDGEQIFKGTFPDVPEEALSDPDHVEALEVVESLHDFLLASDPEP
jgi:hypothetical protein